MTERARAIGNHNEGRRNCFICSRSKYIQRWVRAAYTVSFDILLRIPYGVFS